MVKRIGQKLRGAAGASVIMALSIMMVVAALSASMLSIAITAPQAAITQQQEQQAYLAVTSAARLLQNDSAFVDKVKAELSVSTEVRLILKASDGSDVSMLNVKITWADSPTNTKIKIEDIDINDTSKPAKYSLIIP